jgi:hypothetical protein
MLLGHTQGLSPRHARAAYVRWQKVIPLDYDVSWPLDEQPSRVWSEALERLLTDPDAVLPSEV